MGNDGGSIPTRRELVREAAKAPSSTQVKEALREQLEHHWTTCPLSHKPLLRPVVSDSVGNLYNKDSILKYLIGAEDDDISSKADCDEILQGRVKGLKDVVELKFEIDTESDSKKETESTGERWICPVTTKQLGPNVKSVYIVPCGHVFAEEAVREMKADKCLQCNEPYTEDNVITILPTKETDKQQLMARGRKLAEQGLTHSLKKLSGSKKRKKRANGEASATAAVEESAAATSKTDSISTKSKQSTSSSLAIKNASTAVLTAKVLEEENERTKRTKVARSENLQGLFHSDTDKSRHHIKDGDFMTRGFSIPTNARR